jgi:hypothetical protein
VSSFTRRKEAKLAVALATAALVLTPAFAAGPTKRHAPAVSLSFDPIGSFTPANADPNLAAALAGRGMSLTDFKFTPAPAKGRPSQAMLAQSAAPTAAVNALTPSSYNLGVGVGWRRFAVAGDISKIKDADSAIGGRKTAVVGVSYSLKRFTGRVAVGTDQADGHPLPALRRGDNVSLDVGGSYSLSRRIALTGGVRYNVERDRLSTLQDDRRDSQAVYVGTAFKF